MTTTLTVAELGAKEGSVKDLKKHTQKDESRKSSTEEKRKLDQRHERIVQSFVENLNYNVKHNVPTN